MLNLKYWYALCDIQSCNECINSFSTFLYEASLGSGLASYSQTANFNAVAGLSEPGAAGAAGAVGADPP